MIKSRSFVILISIIVFQCLAFALPAKLAIPELDRQITICIPTYNSERTIRACVEEVSKYGRYQFLIYDNGSTDNTREIIQDLMKTHDIMTRTIPHQEFQDKMLSKTRNIILMRTELAKDVKTPYLFFLDSDVILSEPVEPLIDDLKSDIGMAGYSYERSSHLQMGATMLKTSLARKIDWGLKEHQCECLNARDCLYNMGYRTMEITGAGVKHDKAKIN